MAGVTDSRLAIGAALEAAGLRVTFDPYKVVPPAVLVKGTTPWIAPTALTTRARALRWEVTAVAGKADATATVTDLEALVVAVLAALAALDRSFGSIAFDGPATVDIGGGQYLAAVGRLDHVTEV